MAIIKCINIILFIFSKYYLLSKIFLLCQFHGRHLDQLEAIIRLLQTRGFVMCPLMCHVSCVPPDIIHCRMVGSFSTHVMNTVQNLEIWKYVRIAMALL